MEFSAGEIHQKVIFHFGPYPLLTMGVWLVVFLCGTLCILVEKESVMRLMGIPGMLKDAIGSKISSSINLLIIMCGISIMMVAFGYMVKMLVAVLGVTMVGMAGGGLAILVFFTLCLKFMNGDL